MDFLPEGYDDQETPLNEPQLLGNASTSVSLEGKGESFQVFHYFVACFQDVELNTNSRPEMMTYSEMYNPLQYMISGMLARPHISMCIVF